MKRNKQDGIYLFCIFGFLFFNVTSLYAQQPPSVKRSEKVETIDGKRFYLHTIEKGQTLYSIAKAYGTTGDIILANNPDEAGGLKAGDKLKIPLLGPAEGTKKEIEKKENASVRTHVPDSARKQLPKTEIKPASHLPPKKDSVPAIAAEAVKPIGDIHVALFLPFSLNEVDAIDVQKISQGDEKLPEDVKTGIEFYEGVKLAFDSLRKNGFKGYLHVYDTNLDSAGFARLLKKPELKEMDLMIGPLFGKKFETVARFAKENNILIVSPTLQGNNILMGNPHVSKSTPSYVTQADIIGRFVGERFAGQNIIVFNSASPKDKAYINTFKRTANTLLAKAGADTAKEITFTTMKNFMSKTKVNIVVIPSTNQSFVTEAVNKLFLDKQENKDSIIVFGMSNWNETESLDFSYLHALYAYVTTFDFVDYADPATKRFILKYRNEFNTEPTRYVYSGFDIGYYYLNGLQKYGYDLQKKLPELQQKGIQTEFNFFQADANSGYENKGVGIMKFEKYAYTRVR